MIDKFVYLKEGLAALLVFAGVKILVADVYEMPIPPTLGVIVGILAISIVASVIVARRQTLIEDPHLPSESAA
jgi:tellurite resistance protein TerC